MPGSPIDAQRIKEIVRTRLLGQAEGSLDRLSPPERRLRVRAEVTALLREERAILPAAVVTDVVNQVSDEVVGLGPIERLLRDPEVSEVMVNGADDVFVERKGRIERVGDLFLALTYLTHHVLSSRLTTWNRATTSRKPFSKPSGTSQTSMWQTSTSRPFGGPMARSAPSAAPRTPATSRLGDCGSAATRNAASSSR
jgi:hypothetical protein